VLCVSAEDHSMGHYLIHIKISIDRWVHRQMAVSSPEMFLPMMEANT
jgi:hypothetical protein